jgi:riboflavin kinase/FMN adenylyltransferase
VVGGYQEGRKMGFPTANIRLSSEDKLLPTDGVYAVWVTIKNERLTISDKRLLGMLNIGYRPTLNNGQERSIEVHILDFEGDLYGKNLTVEFVCRLREEQAFVSKKELTEQLKKDRERVMEILNYNP